MNYQDALNKIEEERTAIADLYEVINKRQNTIAEIKTNTLEVLHVERDSIKLRLKVLKDVEKHIKTA